MGGRRPRLALAGLALALGACQANAQVDADREAYRILDARRASVPEVAGSLDVAAAEAAAAGARVPKTLRLDLHDALCLATRASREYRGRREDAYLAALAYTGARHAFDTTYALGQSTDVVQDGTGGTVSASPSATASKAFETGGSLVLKIATDFLRSFSGDPIETARTVLSADLLVPLGRGSGRDVAREALTQAERDVLYALRDFARYQQEFAVRVASSYLRTLQGRDTLENERASYESLARLYERVTEFGKAGRVADFDVDRAKQDLLSAEDRRVRAAQSYDAALDSLKLELGVPTETVLELDHSVLDDMAKAGPAAAPFDVEAGTTAARTRRLDLANARDRVDDAVRKVWVAQRAMGPDVDLRVGGDVATPGKRPLDLRDARASGRLGLDVDLPFDRVEERNALRTARITADRARRDAEGLEDEVVREVRDAARTLDQARKSYDIQREGVRIAARRKESADLHLQRGDATTRDVLEAEDSQILAKNALTAALVDYAIALLELQRDAGTLRPDAVAGGAICEP
jgi:outer membrane protein TolC